MTEPVESINELNNDLFNPEEVDRFSDPIKARKKAMDYLARLDGIDKAGSWYSYKEDRIGQGKENVREFLKTHPEASAEIEQQIRAKLLPARKKFSDAAVAEDSEPVEAVAKEA